jgi:hypothetical protein
VRVVSGTEFLVAAIEVESLDEFDELAEAVVTTPEIMKE